MNNETDNKMFFNKNVFIQAQYNKKWKIDDNRRIIFYVEFNKGFIWFPKDEEIELIAEAREICFNHNIKYKNLDKEQKEK
jgi:regulatory protein YycI of two-component signal transduction system YycFG